MMSTSDNTQHVFECVAGDLFDTAALFAHHVMVMRLKRLGQFGKGCPASDCRRGDAELRKELQRTIHAGSVYPGSLPSNLAVFKWCIGIQKRLEDSLARLGNTLVRCT